MSYKPYDGGIEFSHAVKMDPQGWIPGWIKDQAKHRMGMSLKNIVNYCRDGTVPDALY